LQKSYILIRHIYILGQINQWWNSRSTRFNQQWDFPKCIAVVNITTRFVVNGNLLLI